MEKIKAHMNDKLLKFLTTCFYLYYCQQAEWELTLNFIVAFPSVVKDTVPKITAKSKNVTIHTNKVRKHHCSL